MVAKFLDLPPGAPPVQLLAAARDLCRRPWAYVTSHMHGTNHLERYCLWGPYVVLLLHDGLQLGHETVNIGTGDVGWPLGAALLEVSASLPHMLQPGGQRLVPPGLGSVPGAGAGGGVGDDGVLALVLGRAGALEKGARLQRQPSMEQRPSSLQLAALAVLTVSGFFVTLALLWGDSKAGALAGAGARGRSWRSRGRSWWRGSCLSRVVAWAAACVITRPPQQCALGPSAG